MAKAIVKINAFLNEKQTKDVYNMIYDQLKAGLDVITVPFYCDVYIFDGSNIEVQTSESQKIKTHVEDVVKSCLTCKYEYNMGHYHPCISCTHNDKWEKWEAKENE